MHYSDQLRVATQYAVALVAIATLMLAGCGGGSSSSAPTAPSAPSGPTLQLMGGAMQGAPLNLTTAVTTLAGSAVGYADGSGSLAQFNFPYGVTTDGSNLYVADFSNNRIRKIVIATGAVSTLAGNGFPGSTDGIGAAAQFSHPTGITTDGTNLYVAGYGDQRIRKIVIATGEVTTVAGSTMGFADGTGSAAQFNWPRGITTDGTNLYVADTSNSNIRKVVIATGVVTTLAGSVNATSGNLDGIGSAARFNNPYAITTDGTYLYVVDTFNNTIRKIVPATGEVTTLAGGTGYADGTGMAARFWQPEGITTDGTNLYIADVANQRLRKLAIATGLVSTLAGSGVVGSVDGTGTAAQFNNPRGITSDGASLYVVDMSNHRIRKIH
ncbi:MAG: hypothetical protein C0406_03050 [Sideroxydans sp.]|nr:hypothetical protein [Sideroxydans sp.]